MQTSRQTSRQSPPRCPRLLVSMTTATAHRPAGILVGSAILLAALAIGCGGGDKKAAEEPAPAPAQPAEPGEDTLIPPEKFDAIQTFFERKRRVVSRCFSEAVDSGELGKNAKGFVTVQMIITEDGTLSDMSVAESSLESDSLHRCIIEYLTKWTVTTLPKPLDYTYTFSFQTL